MYEIKSKTTYIQVSEFSGGYKTVLLMAWREMSLHITHFALNLKTLDFCSILLFYPPTENVLYSKNQVKWAFLKLTICLDKPLSRLILHIPSPILCVFVLVWNGITCLSYGLMRMPMTPNGFRALAFF